MSNNSQPRPRHRSRAQAQSRPLSGSAQDLSITSTSSFQHMVAPPATTSESLADSDGDRRLDRRSVESRMSRIKFRKLNRLIEVEKEGGGGFIDRTTSHRNDTLSSLNSGESSPNQEQSRDVRITMPPIQDEQVQAGSDAIDSHNDPSDDGGSEGDGYAKPNSLSSPGATSICNPSTSLTLSWDRVRFSINLKGKKHKKILHGVTGEAKPGEMIAIMGSSGAGKSTLLNILAGRISMGVIHGEILVNNQPRPLSWKRIVGYVEQEDLMYTNLTVRETLCYAALLRLPRYISREQKMARVGQVITELGLAHVANTFIGNNDIRGVSGGERKRVSIGIELVANPRLLFLDEPTSGLDAFTAYNIMESISVLAVRESKTVIMTLHQPREDILFLFDKVMLLSEGETVYFGSTLDAMGYFEKLGFVCPNFMNPADFFMDTITIDSRSPKALADSRARLDKFKAAWHAIDIEYQATRRARLLDEGTDGRASMPVGSIQPALDLMPTQTRPFLEDKAAKNKHIRWNNSWWAELSILFHRGITEQIRNKYILAANIVQTIFLILVVGFVFFQLGLTQSSIQARIGALFFVVVNLTFSVMQPLFTLFPLERLIIVRERYAATYRASTVFVAKALSVMPIRAAFTLLYGLSIYYIIGFNPNASNYFIFQGILLCVMFAALGLGFVIGAIARDVPTAQIIGPLIILIFYVYGGNLSNDTTIPAVIRWLQYLSLIKYGYSALMQNEFVGLVFICDNGQPATDAKSCAPGYSNGEEVLLQYHLTQFSISTCCLILVGMGFGFHVIAYLCLKWRSKPTLTLATLPPDEASVISEEDEGKESDSASAKSPQDQHSIALSISEGQFVPADSTVAQGSNHSSSQSTETRSDMDAVSATRTPADLAAPLQSKQLSSSCSLTPQMKTIVSTSSQRKDGPSVALQIPPMASIEERASGFDSPTRRKFSFDGEA